MFINNTNNKESKKAMTQSDLCSMKTYGDILYDFCLYRHRLKFFLTKRMQLRKINRLLNLTYEIVRAVTLKSDLEYTQEFYRELNYQKYQKHIRSHMQVMIIDDIGTK